MFSVFKNINRFAGRSKVIDWTAVFCARYLLFLLLFVLLIYAFAISRWEVFFVPFLSGLFGAFVLDKIVYVFYKRQRPAELEGAKILIRVPKNPSFPSRHASLLFGISFCLFFFSFPFAIFFVICSCLVGIARVFCGVHWFLDILAGAVVGLASSFLIFGLFNL